MTDRSRLVLLSTSLITVAGFLACTPDTPKPGGKGREAKSDKAQAPAVEAVQSRVGQLPVRERLTGTVRANGQVNVLPEVAGPVTAVLVQNGDTVTLGQPLVRIRATGSASQLDQARASIDVAKADVQQSRAGIAELEATFARTQTLAKEKLVSAEAVETERARLEGAKASLQQALARVTQAEATARERREAVGQMVVRSPIAGVVGNRQVEVGMLASPSRALFVVGNFDKMRVEVDVPQELLGRVSPGKPVEIWFGEDDEVPVVAEISRVSPFLSSASFSARAEIDIVTQTDLLPGMFVSVDILYGQTEPVTLLPKSALVEHPITDARGVYVAAGLKSPTLEPVPPGLAPLTAPTPVTFVEVDVIEEGAHIAGVTGLDEGVWSLIIGQHLIAREVSAPEGVSARVRPVQWERVLGQQRLQRDDLLKQHLNKQQRIADEEKARRQTNQAQRKSVLKSPKTDSTAKKPSTSSTSSTGARADAGAR